VVDLPTAAEMATAKLLLDRLPTHGEMGEAEWRVALAVAGRSPWLTIKFLRLDPHPVDEPHEVEYAIWRETGNAYEIGELGAVADDRPIVLP
jgi:hypothetical protein